MCDCFNQLCGVTWSPASARGAEQELQERYELAKGNPPSAVKVKEKEKRPKSQAPPPVQQPLSAEEASNAERAAQKEKLHAELKQVLQLKGQNQRRSLQPSDADMDPKKTVTEEDVKKSEMVQIVMETEAEAGVSGISVSGGGKSGLFIKDVKKDSPAAKSLSLQEGDQILSAKVYFDNVKYEDALQILQCAEPYKISFCLKRNVQSADVSMSPGTGTFETVKSLKPVKKVKSLGKGSKEGTLREAEDVDGEISAGKIDIPPVDVEFSLPKFGKFRKAKGLTAAESEGASPDLKVKRSSSDAKVMRLKLPRMKVKEAAAVEGLALEVRGPSGKKSSTLPGDKVDTKGLEVEGKVKAKSPRFGISLPKSKKNPLPKADIEVKEDIKFKAPQVELEVSVPTSKADVAAEGLEMSGKGESFQLKIPKFGTTSKIPDVEVKPSLSLDKDEVEDESPQEKPKMLTMPKIGVSLPGLESEVNGSGTTIKSLEEKANIGVKLPSVAIAAPEVDIDLSLPNVEGAVIARAGDKIPKDVHEKGEGFQMKMPKFGVSAKVPKVDLDMSLSQDTVDTGVKKTEFKMPEMKVSEIEISFPKSKAEGEMGISVQKAKMDSDIPDGKYNTGIRIPSLDISAPKLDVDITLPKKKQELDGSSDYVGYPSEPNIEIPDVTIKMPKISLPKFGVKSKEGHLDVHALPSKVQGDVTLTKHGEIEEESPDMKTKGPKMKMPSFGLSLTKDKHDVSAAQVEIKTKEPEVAAEGNLKFPDLKMPSIDIKAPQVTDIELPKANISISGIGDEGEMKSYKSESLERPDIKFTLPSVSLPKFDTSVESERPEMNVKVSPPKIGAVAKIPKLESGLKDGDLEMHTGKLSIPKVNISVPKIKPMELEVTSSKTEVDLSIGKPKVGEKPVNVDIKLKSHELEMESSKNKIDLPSVKMPVLNIDVPKVDLNINLPQAKTEISDYGIDEPDAKWKMPKVSLPAFHGQEKDMDMQHDVSSAKLGVDLKTPHVGVDVKGAGLTGKLQGIMMPKIGISFPEGTLALDDEMKLQDPKLKAKIDKKLPEVKTVHDNTQGSLEGKIQLPSVTLPSVEIMTPALPEVDIEAGTPKASLRPSAQADVAVTVSGESEGKLKSHKFSLPRFGMSGSKTKKGEGHTKAPQLEGEADIPDVTVKGPRLKMPKFGRSFPKAKLDLESSADAAESSAKTDFKGPKGQLAIAGSKDGLDLMEAKIKLPAVELPQVDIAVPKVDIGINAAKVKGNGHIEGSNEFPSAGGIQAPEINIEVPDVQLEMPAFSLPSMGGKAKEGELDVAFDSSKTSAKAKIEVSADGSPGGSEVTVTDGKVKIKEGKMKMPKFRIPSFNLSKKEVDVSGGKVEVGISPPEMNVKLKKEKAEVPEPEVDIESPEGKVKLSFMKMPKFKMASPKGKAHGSDLKVSAESDVRGSEEDLQGSNLHMKMPQISLPKFRSKEGKTDIGADATLPKDTSDIDLKPGTVKMPSLEILAPSIKPDIEIPIPKTTADLSGEDLIEYKQDLKMPFLDVSAPSLELGLSLPTPKVGSLLQQEGKSEVALEKSEVKLQMPKVALPSIGLPDLRGRGTATEEKEAEMHLLTGKKEKVYAITLKPQNVRLDSDGTEGSSEDEKATGKGSKIKMPTLDISMPKIRTQDADIPFADANVDIEGPGFRDVEGRFSLPFVELPKLPTPHLQAPELELDINIHKDGDVPVDPGFGKTHFEMKVPDIELSGPDVERTNLKFKMPKMKMSAFGGSSTEGKSSESEHAEGGIRGVKIKMPKLQLGSLKGKTDDSEAITEGEVKVKETSADIMSHDLEPHSGKIKFKVPAVGISVGGGEVKERDADMQPLHPKKDEKELKIKVPKISIPDVGFTESEAKVGAGHPGAEFKVDEKLKATKVQSPKSAGFGDLEVGLSDAKMKMPHVKVPSIGISGWKGKSDDDMTVSLGSKADFHAEEMEGRKSHFKMPDVEFSGPKIKAHGEYEIENAMVQPAAYKDKEAVASPVTISGKMKADKKDGTKTPDTEEDDDAGKKYQVQFPKFGISLPKVGMEGDSENPELKGVGELSFKPGTAELETEKQAGKVKMPKVKKAVFVIMKSKEKGAEATSGLLESDVDSKTGTLEIEQPTADVKIKLPKIKKKPSFGMSRSKQKGAEVNGDFDASARDDSDAKGSKMKFPKLGFSNSKTDALDVNVNGSAPSGSSPQLNGDHEASLENGSQDNKAKLAKLKFPKLEFSSPYKGKEPDSEMNLKLVKTEEQTSKDEVQGSTFGAIKGTKFKPGKMSFSGFKKKTDKTEDIEGSTNIVTSSARTEMASMETEGEGESKSSKSKISIGFFSSKSRGEYIVDNSGGVSKSESAHVASYEGSDADSKEKTARFKFPKISLGQKSQGMGETSGHSILEKGVYSEGTGEEEGMSGFKVSLPQLGFSTYQEHTSEEHIITEEGGSILQMTQTKRVKTETGPETSII
ncbi:periaxin isoform X2 [Pleurodeles waltl]|uniref:periaxin isoform X2 n=1 Tax=Pleurodeles waltl TaxID=8319 RepID=UPI0037094D84